MYIKIFFEYNRQNGKKVGIVTNDKVVGATPSAFTVHANSRSDYDVIASSFVSFAPMDLASGMEKPEQVTPTKPITRKFSDETLPTAAKASLPINRPTIIVSTKEYIC